jgi:HK97 family phage prohead protease
MGREIIRALGGLELIEPPGDGTIGTLIGRLAIFGEWAEIDSAWEGHFLERVSRGSFLKTIERDATRYKPLFQHGHDPNIGGKVLGPIRSLREDDHGAAYEIGLLDTAYNRDLLPGLKAGLYGSSFRGTVEQERFERHARTAPHNPTGLDERTVEEVSLLDFGPVTFPAYLGATAGARSLSGRADAGGWTPARRRGRLLEAL